MGLFTGGEREIFRLALGSLLAHKLRGALTVVGIVIGITSVVGMVSLVEGLNRSMQNQLDALGSDTIRIRRFDAGVFVGEIPDSLRKRREFDMRDAEGIRETAASVASQYAIGQDGGKRAEAIHSYAAFLDHRAGEGKMSLISDANAPFRAPSDQAVGQDQGPSIGGVNAVSTPFHNTACGAQRRVLCGEDPPEFVREEGAVSQKHARGTSAGESQPRFSNDTLTQGRLCRG